MPPHENQALGIGLLFLYNEAKRKEAIMDTNTIIYAAPRSGRYGFSFNFSGNSLKGLAVAAMIAQHIAILFLVPCTPLHGILYEAGRITAPIMCFFVAEGYFHTSSLPMYLYRLFLLAIVSHIPHALAFGFSPWDIFHATSILWGLFLGLGALAACKTDLPLVWKGSVVFLCCLLSYPANFNAITVLWILTFGLLRRRPLLMWAAYTGLVFLYVLEASFISATDAPWSRLWFLAAIPLLLSYSGNRGRKSRLFQWGYYLIYPVHFLILYALRLALG